MADNDRYKKGRYVGIILTVFMFLAILAVIMVIIFSRRNGDGDYAVTSVRNVEHNKDPVSKPVVPPALQTNPQKPLKKSRSTANTQGSPYENASQRAKQFTQGIHTVGITEKTNDRTLGYMQYMFDLNNDKPHQPPSTDRVPRKEPSN